MKVADWIMHIFYEDGSEDHKPFCEGCGKEREEEMKKMVERAKEKR